MEDTTKGSSLREQFPMIADLLENRPGYLWVLTSVVAVGIYLWTFIAAVIMADGILVAERTVIGGDFMVFWSAAEAFIAGDGAEFYQQSVLREWVANISAALKDVNVTWQYPPTMYFLVAPFAGLPYIPAYGVFSIANLAVFYLLLSRIWNNQQALFITLAASGVFQALITGQTGFFTAVLLVVAGGGAKSRPLLAGLAAGLLTVKPQFGLLIPIAFAAGGYWRAFAAATISAAVLIGASYLAFGIETWTAFFDAVRSHSERMQSVIFPYAKVISLYGGLKIMGAPTAFALAAQGFMTIGLVGFIWLVWRRNPGLELRVMTLCTAAPLATPYAFYYESPIMVAAMFMLAKRGVESGWLKGERLLLPILWAAPIFANTFIKAPSPPVMATATILAFALAARRAFHELDIKLTFPGRTAAA